jgi:catechol 2,3-dioxygenase-like lactoylglutathione lyase family enzyme
MPIPAPNLYPPFNIVRLSHVELVVTDLAKFRAFYVDTLGLQVSDETADTIYLRALEERAHHCIVLKKGSAGEARDLGFKVFGEEDLDKAAYFFNAKGLPVEWTERPYQSRTFRTRDPHGIPLEFHSRMERLPPIHQKYALYKGVKPLGRRKPSRSVSHVKQDREAMTVPVCVIGLGSMGFGAAVSLLRAGFDVRGVDVRPEALERFTEAGGRAMSSPAEGAQECGVVFVFVVNAAQTEAVLFGVDGAADVLAPRSVVAACATVAPDAVNQRHSGEATRPSHRRDGRARDRPRHRSRNLTLARRQGTQIVKPQPASGKRIIVPMISDGVSTVT